MKKIMIVLASMCASNTFGMNNTSEMYIANPDQAEPDRAQLHMAHLRVMSPEPGRRTLLGAGIENTRHPAAHSAAGAPIIIAQAPQAHLLGDNDELYDADQSYNEAAHAQDFDDMGLPIGAEPDMYEETRDACGKKVYRLKAEYRSPASASATSESPQQSHSHMHNDALQAQQQPELKAIDESPTHPSAHPSAVVMQPLQMLPAVTQQASVIALEARQKSHHENVQQHQSTHAATAAAAQPASALIPAKPQPRTTQGCCIIA